MAYLGRQRSETTPSVLRATYTGDGSTTTYALPGSVANEQSIIATINGVTQQDAAYSTNGSQIIFSSAPASGDAIEIRVISTVGLSYAPSAGSVTTPILADGAITGAKIANAAVSDALIAGVSASKVSGALTSANMPAGSVIQVVQGTFESATTTTSTTAVATGLSASITPSSASNKVLVIVHGSHQNVTSGTTNIYPLFKNGSVLKSTFMIYSAPAPDGVAMSAAFLDSPATTSSTTYALYFYTENGGYTASFGSQTGAGFYLNTITLMEIAA